MTTPKGVKGQQVQVETTKPGAQRLLMNNRCVAPRAYEKAILAIKKQCPDIGSRLYLTSGFRTEYRMVKGTPQSRRVANRCAQAEYFSPGEPNMKLNKAVLSCLKRSAASRAVGNIQDGKKVLSALKKTVDDSIPSHWQRNKEYYIIGGGSLLTFFLFGKHAINAWRGKGPGNPLGGGNSKPTGDGGTSSAADGSTSAAADTASKMVAAVLGIASAIANRLDDIKMPPLAPPISPLHFDLDPVHPIGSAPIGYEDPNYVPISTSTSISWAAVGAWLSSAATAIENIWAPHSADTNTWADHKIGEPMAQAGRNMAAAMTAGAQKLMSVKPKNMPTVVFTGLVIVTAPIWVPAVLAYGSLSLAGSMIGPTLPELMNEHDKMTGKKTPGPA